MQGGYGTEAGGGSSPTSRPGLYYEEGWQRVAVGIHEGGCRLRSTSVHMHRASRQAGGVGGVEAETAGQRHAHPGLSYGEASSGLLLRLPRREVIRSDPLLYIRIQV